MPFGGDAAKGAIRGGRRAAIEGTQEATHAVIGKMDDIAKLGRGEHTLVQHMMDDLGSPKANWYQNSRVLRTEMQKGIPIRDASISKTGELINNSGFLKAERNLLSNRGWTYNPSTGFWTP